MENYITVPDSHENSSISEIGVEWVMQEDGVYGYKEFMKRGLKPFPRHLYLAISFGLLEMVEFLLGDCGIDPNSQGWDTSSFDLIHIKSKEK